ncbi:MAG: DEAD/DEAH box helicase [Gammaproteobacteria bacterium]|nr:DEAD/DEAH box helicase [Gammaproteobacteria bacterium]
MAIVKNLFQQYQAEPALNQRILQIKALLFYAQKEKTAFAACIIESTLRTDQNKPLTLHQLNQILEHLKKSGLLLEDLNCHPDILHQVSAEAVRDQNKDASANLALLKSYPEYKLDYVFRETYTLKNIRILHLALHLNQTDLFLDEQLELSPISTYFLNNIERIIFNFSLDEAWIKTRHPIIQLFLLCAKLRDIKGVLDLQLPMDESFWLDYLRTHRCIDLAIQHGLDQNAYFMNQLIQIELYFGGLPALQQEQKLPLMAQTYAKSELTAALALLKGDRRTALKEYPSAIKQFSEWVEKQHWAGMNLHALLYMLAILSSPPTTTEIKQAMMITAHLRKISLSKTADILDAILHLKLNKKEQAIACLNTKLIYTHPFYNAILAWLQILITPEDFPKRLKHFRSEFKKCQDSGHLLAAQLYAELILIQDPSHSDAQDFLTHIAPLGHFRLMSILTIKQSWEYAIDQLHHVLTDKTATFKKSLGAKRLAWFIHPEKKYLDLAEQSMSKNGTWTAGKAIALKRFFQNDAKLDYLTAQDRKILKNLSRQTYGWYHEVEFSWDTNLAFQAMIGHPFIFRSDNTSIPLELVEGQLILQIEKVKNGYHLALSKQSTSPTVFLEKETTNRYQVISFGEDALTVSNILGGKGITIPAAAKERVIDMICKANSTIRIQSDIEDDTLPILSGNTTPCVHLLPIREGLKAHLWMRPFGDQGLYCRAGEGQKSMIGELQTPQGLLKQKVLRDFKQEQKSIATLIDQCPSFTDVNDGSTELYFESLESSLEVLLELEEYKQKNPLTLEWPKGQTFKVKSSISAKNMSLSITGRQHWFEYDGEVKIDENKTIGIKQLLDLLDQGHGRFIPLENGEFIALTEQFKKQLEDLKALSDGNKVYYLSTAGLRELSDEAGTLQEDAAWTKHLKKIKAMAKHKPILSSTLQAELRDYQLDGFAYLSRLTHWEIGACLADDMGLGKTVQAIALLLSHAEQGPCLVIAPTSVCFIWLEELAKFAPTLTPHILHNTNDREGLIQSLGKMDILICSYGLLHQAGDALLNKHWKMVILDEAQAIKNSATKRWKYATQLNSSCRVALTGTPIENHLGELWSIFQFLNPGLLGSLKHFQEHFSGPIEKDKDPIAKRALKNLVSPYILRRTKTEVLPELPAKIEQSILIEPTPEEMAFYEAVRIKALERIQKINATEGGTKRFSILAEISRLRQACCSASLVDEAINIESSKIKTFITMTKNMLDNKHKVLVFSQYVRYLDQIKTALNAESIRYQYLDGSTPMKERQRAVNAFQAGEGDLFLISLKAGGTGLNLTAADYVIILDPWWNPAVEDQAADRAHRMGQQRPVTVYRLIMKNSIEEKIVALHKNKKDLAADLLSGSDMNGKLSEEELVNLITT